MLCVTISIVNINIWHDKWYDMTWHDMQWHDRVRHMTRHDIFGFNVYFPWYRGAAHGNRKHESLQREAIYRIASIMSVSKLSITATNSSLDNSWKLRPRILQFQSTIQYSCSLASQMLTDINDMPAVSQNGYIIYVINYPRNTYFLTRDNTTFPTH